MDFAEKYWWFRETSPLKKVLEERIDTKVPKYSKVYLVVSVKFFIVLFFFLFHDASSIRPYLTTCFKKIM